MNIGLQLYSVRNSLNADPAGTLQKISQIGYRYVETACHNVTPSSCNGTSLDDESFCRLVSQLGLSVAAAHVNPVTLQNVENLIQRLKALSCNRIVIPMLFFKTREDVVNTAALLNQIGQVCAQEKMQLYYHNHFFEFKRFDSFTILDLLMNQTDPELVHLELDVFWAYRGGAEPVAFLRKHGKRVSMLHMKDLDKSFQNDMNLLKNIPDNTYIDMEYFQSCVNPLSFTEMGKGCIDYPRFLRDISDYCAPDFAILEQDFSALNELESIQISFEYLKTLFAN